MNASVASTTKRILFVDDEVLLLEGLRDMLRRFRSTWDMSFANGAASAIERMHEARFDVVVCDLHLRGQGGLALLEEVKQHNPKAVRIILSGTSDQALVLSAVGVAHQFLAKPCRAEELRATIERSLALRDLLTSERLARVAARLHSLPTLPALYHEIQAALGKAGGSIEEVGRIVARDVAMSAKVIQLVNSAFFGLARRISSAGEAVTYLGMDTIKALVLGEQVFEHALALEPERLELMRTHSLRTAASARAIARLEGHDRKAAEQAFLAGMLHEVGLLLLMTEMEDELGEAWKYARRFGLPCAEGERRVIGATHAAVGAYLMGIWGLPDSVVQAIAFHHTPSVLAEERLSALGIVHAATTFDCGHEGSAFGETERELDAAYFERLGLTARLPVWGKECAEILAGKSAR